MILSIMIVKMQLATLENRSKQARPFLKWAGGKSQLLEQFEEYYPIELKHGQIDRYIEPFIGGGAVFFHIAHKYNIKKAYLYDINPELILVLKTVQQSPFVLIERLDEISERYKELSLEARRNLYYEMREKYNRRRNQMNYESYSDAWVLRAAQLIFLNKTCFNGLFRMNTKGEFNVPYGSYQNPRILDGDNIISASKLLQIAEIKTGDFENCETHVTSSSFIYFDPPYRPISQTASFTAYSKLNFDDKSQIRLARFFRYLDKTHHIKIMLSNSDPMNEDPSDLFFEDLYSGFNIRKVHANRMINCNGKKRGQINELLITNY